MQEDKVCQHVLPPPPTSLQLVDCGVADMFAQGRLGGVVTAGERRQFEAVVLVPCHMDGLRPHLKTWPWKL